MALATPPTIVPNPTRYTRTGREDWKTIRISGKDTYDYAELLDRAHQAGLIAIETEITHIDFERGMAVARAVAYFSDGTHFTGIGDASPDNCSREIARHFPRQAETRAVSRALTKGLNAETNADVEFDTRGSSEGDTRQASQPRQPARSSSGGQRYDNPPPNDGNGGYACEECGEEIKDSANGKWKAEQLAAFSKRDTGRILCYKHKQAAMQAAG